MIVVETLASVLMVVGAALVLVTAIAFFRLRDSLSRINAFGPATALGLPMLTLGAVIAWTSQHGFDALVIIKALLMIGAFVAVSSVGSNVLARAAYRSGSPLAEPTTPNELDSAEGE